MVNKSVLRLRQNINRMHQLGIERRIAGVSSLLNSMIMDGDQLTGAELASAFKEKFADGRSLSASGEEVMQIAF